MTAGWAGRRDPDASLPGGPEAAGGRSGLALLKDRIRSATRAAAAEVTDGRRRAAAAAAAAAGRAAPAAARRPDPAGPGPLPCQAGAAAQGLVPLAAAASVLAVLGGVVSLAPGTSGVAAAGPRGVVQLHRTAGLDSPAPAHGAAPPASAAQSPGAGQRTRGMPARPGAGTAPGSTPQRPSSMSAARRSWSRAAEPGSPPGSQAWRRRPPWRPPRRPFRRITWP